MKTTRHTDARGLALNVKCYNLGRDVPADAEGTDAQQMRAQEDAGRVWWNAAEDIAKAHGFRKVWSAGRMGGWLYTEPLPEVVADDDGGEEPGEYPAAFVEELQKLLDRAPEIYADTLAEIIADDAIEAEEQAARDALPARLAAALAAVLPFVPFDGNHADESTKGKPMRDARSALADYLDMLLDAECHRDLTEAEAAIVADARKPASVSA